MSYATLIILNVLTIIMIQLMLHTLVQVIAFASIRHLASFLSLLLLLCSFISLTLVIIPGAYFRLLWCIMNAFLLIRGRLMSGSLRLCGMHSFGLKFVSLRFRTLSSSMDEFCHQTPISEFVLLSLTGLICNSIFINQHQYFQVYTQSKSSNQSMTL